MYKNKFTVFDEVETGNVILMTFSRLFVCFSSYPPSGSTSVCPPARHLLLPLHSLSAADAVVSDLDDDCSDASSDQPHRLCIIIIRSHLYHPHHNDVLHIMKMMNHSFNDRLLEQQIQNK